MSNTSHTPQKGGLTRVEGIQDVLPMLAADISTHFRVGIEKGSVDCGRFGCVIPVDGDRVVKLTADPTEPIGWLYVQGRQQSGHLPFLEGAATIEQILKVRVALPKMFGGVTTRILGMALVERVVPARAVWQRRGDAQRVKRAARWVRSDGNLITPLDQSIDRIVAGCRTKKLPNLAHFCSRAPTPVTGLCNMLQDAATDGVWYTDTFDFNLGWRFERTPGLVLYDFGKVEYTRRGHRERLQKRWKAMPIVDMAP